MDRTFDQTLRGLLPALNGDLPPELIQLSRSLLNQSRAKASLKQDEEVARTYVCAHIACERLKQPLNLPRITPRPPVPPRVYAKLHKFFTTALPPSRSQTQDRSRDDIGPSTPSRTRRAGAGAGAAASPPEQSRMPTSRTSAKRSNPFVQGVGVKTDDGVPDWAMPAIRQLSKTLDAPRAAPHAYAGISSVLELLRRDRLGAGEPLVDEVLAARLPALLITVFLYVKVRLDGRQLTAAAFASYRDTAIEVLATMGKTGGRSQRDVVADVAGCVNEAKEEWLGMEWFGNVPEGEGDEENLEEDGEGVEQIEDWDGIEDGVEGGGLQGGLGTMVQEKVNWLSQERREDFVRWRKGVMVRIEQLESEQGTVAMDTS